MAGLAGQPIDMVIMMIEGFKEFLDKFISADRYPMVGFLSEGEFFLGADSKSLKELGSTDSYLDAGQKILGEPAAAFYATSREDVVGGYREDCLHLPDDHPLRLFWNGWDSKIGMGNIHSCPTRERAVIDVSFNLFNIKHPFGLVDWDGAVPFSPNKPGKYVSQFEAMYGSDTVKFCNWDIWAYLRTRKEAQNHPHKVVTRLHRPLAMVETEKVTWLDYAISIGIFPMPMVYDALGSVDFSYAWLRNMSFNNSDLADVDFRHCEFNHVDFGNSRIEDAVFDNSFFLPGSNLFFAQGWEKASFSGAAYFKGTVIFPEGFDPKNVGMVEL